MFIYLTEYFFMPNMYCHSLIAWCLGSLTHHGHVCNIKEPVSFIIGFVFCIKELVFTISELVFTIPAIIRQVVLCMDVIQSGPRHVVIIPHLKTDLCLCDLDG